MAKEIYIDSEDLQKGLYVLEDTTKAPWGSARIMKNMRITDRGGIAPRQGTELLGTQNESTDPVLNVFNYKRSLATDEILLKPNGTVIEAYSKNYASAGWWTLKTGLTSGKEFDFTSSLVNVDNRDYVVLCNKYDPYMRWTGELAQLTATLSGGESTIPVDSTIGEDIYVSETGTASSATTMTVSSANWATDQWKNFYIYITDGSSDGKVRKITGNTGTVLTFDTLGSDPGSVTFEIRRLKFPATGTIVYNGTEVAYTAIDTATSFTVSSAHASAGSDDIVAHAVEEIESAPRGNRITNYLNRIIVGSVRSALNRDSAGNKQGSSASGSYYVSKLNENDDFDFSATRVAGEGDIVSTPYGGGDITDVVHQEDTFYIFKERYIEAGQYSQDENDLVVREPLKQETGSINKVIKGSDDVYFMTPDAQYTSLGRVASKDIKPQTENIGTPIKRLLETYGIENFNGIEDGNRHYLCLKKTSTDANNNIVLIYNKLTKSFEGTWDLNANGFAKFNNDSDVYAADSTSANLYKINTGHADIVGSNRYPIVSTYASNFFNLTPSKVNLQSLNSAYFEGYIRGGSSITFKIWKDFSKEPFLEFTFEGEENLLNGKDLQASLGLEPYGLSPMGSIGEADEEGRRHFQFRVYFPYQQANYFSVGWNSNDEDLDYEVTRYGLGISEDISMKNNVKSV